MQDKIAKRFMREDPFSAGALPQMGWGRTSAVAGQSLIGAIVVAHAQSSTFYETQAGRYSLQQILWVFKAPAVWVKRKAAAAR
jgi:hypothetical protein